MSISAAIKFTQGVTTDLAGRAVIGVASSSVTCSNGNNTGVVNWVWVLVDVPYGSSLVAGTVLASGPSASLAFFTPDVYGSYRIQLTVKDSLNNQAIDTRVFAVANSRGWIIPSFQSGSAELNFSGQTRGWANLLPPALEDIRARMDAQLNISGQAKGNIAYYNGTAWTVLAQGTSGQVLSSQGTGSDLTWSNVTANAQTQVLDSSGGVVPGNVIGTASASGGTGKKATGTIAPSGVATSTTSPSGTATIQTTGILTAANSGLGSGSEANAVVDATTGNLDRAAFVWGGERVQGTVDTQGNVTLSRSKPIGTSPAMRKNIKGAPYGAVGNVQVSTDASYTILNASSVVDDRVAINAAIAADNATPTAPFYAQAAEVEIPPGVFWCSDQIDVTNMVRIKGHSVMYETGASVLLFPPGVNGVVLHSPNPYWDNPLNPGTNGSFTDNGSSFLSVVEGVQVIAQPPPTWTPTTACVTKASVAPIMPTTLSGPPYCCAPTLKYLWRRADDQLVAICVKAGTTGSTEPNWPVMAGEEITDGTVTWRLERIAGFHMRSAPHINHITARNFCGDGFRIVSADQYQPNYWATGQAIVTGMRRQPIPVQNMTTGTWSNPTSGSDPYGVGLWFEATCSGTVTTSGSQPAFTGATGIGYSFTDANGITWKAKGSIGTNFGGSCNVWSIVRCWSEANYGNGLNVQGADANQGKAEVLNLKFNLGWGLRDASFLGNRYETLHTAQNGIAGGLSELGVGPWPANHGVLPVDSMCVPRDGLAPWQNPTTTNYTNSPGQTGAWFKLTTASGSTSDNDHEPNWSSASSIGSTVSDGSNVWTNGGYYGGYGGIGLLHGQCTLDTPYQELSQASGVCKNFIYTVWSKSTSVVSSGGPTSGATIVVPSIATNCWYYASSGSTTSTSEPFPPGSNGGSGEWPTAIGSTVSDGGVTWTCGGYVYQPINKGYSASAGATHIVLGGLAFSMQIGYQDAAWIQNGINGLPQAFTSPAIYANGSDSTQGYVNTTAYVGYQDPSGIFARWSSSDWTNPFTVYRKKHYGLLEFSYGISDDPAFYITGKVVTGGDSSTYPGVSTYSGTNLSNARPGKLQIPFGFFVGGVAGSGAQFWQVSTASTAIDATMVSGVASYAPSSSAMTHGGGGFSDLRASDATGDKVFKQSPSAGDPVGWSCTSTGSYSTSNWMYFGRYYTKDLETCTSSELDWVPEVLGTSGTVRPNNRSKVDCYQTTNATPTTIYTYAIPTGTTVVFRYQVVARKTDGSARAVFHRKIVVTNNSGTISTDSADADVETAINSPSWTSPAASVSSTNIIVQVTGVAATNINHSITVDIQEAE